MIKRRIVKCIKALSPVVGTILVVLIVLTVTSTVMLWGLPYLSDLRAQSQQSYIGSQFRILDETFSGTITSGLGSIRENTVTMEEGTLSFENNKLRVVTSYSLLPNYNFSVTNLDSFNSSYDPNKFTLNMYEGRANKAEIFWITTRTPYGKFNSSLVTDEPFIVPGDYEIYHIYNFTDKDNNTAWKINGSVIPESPEFIENNGNLYGDNEYENISYKDNKSNSWVGNLYPKNYAVLMYRFNVKESLASIRKINISWSGDDTFSDGGELYIYIWNVTSKSWEDFTSNPINNIPGMNETYSNEYTSFTNYISNFGYIYIAVVGGLKNNPPNKPINPNPSDGATNVSIDTDLSWTCSDPDGDPLVYDIYFGTSSSPPLVKSNIPSSTYDPGTLNQNTTYYWKIVAKDRYEENSSNIWSFTTYSNHYRPPLYVSLNPYPQNNSKDLPAGEGITLSWSGGNLDGDPVIYKVYFGTMPIPPNIGNTTNNSYYPGFLKPETRYYWRIIAVDSHNAATTGPLWNLRTGNLIGYCLPAGTKITMADGTLKNIENIKIGDLILSYDVENNSYIKSCVNDTLVVKREGIYIINNGLISLTDDHPVYVKKNERLGWASINPEKSKIAYTNRNNIMPLEIGDLLLTKNGEWVKIKSIKFKPGPLKTYTFTIDHNIHNYFANGVLVSNTPTTIPCAGCFLKGTLITMSDLTYKPIEEICIGDRVLSYDLSTKSYCISEVCSIEKTVNIYYTINKGLLNVTDSHPLYVEKPDHRLCWAAIDPKKAILVYGLDEVEKLEIGDRFYLEDGSLSEEIIDIVKMEEDQTYTLSLLDCNTFFANHVTAYSYPNCNLNQHYNTLFEDYVELRVCYNITDVTRPQANITSTDPQLIDGELHTDTITINWIGWDDHTLSQELSYLYRIYPCNSTWVWHNQTSIRLKLDAQGSYIFRVRAVDKAGNVDIERPENVIAINYTIPPFILSSFEVGPGESIDLYCNSSCPDQLSDLILINFYNNNTLFGRTFIFDIDSITYKLHTSSGYYASLIENGAILFENNGYIYFYKKPTITDENGLICLRIIHTTTNDVSFYSAGKGIINIQTILTGNTFRHSNKAYNLWVSFYGPTSKLWIDYFTNNCNFITIDSGNNLILYNRDIKNFLLSHSILEISIQSIGR